MRAFITVILLFAIIPCNAAPLAEDGSPYVEISINGLEELAPPLNRLADAVEELSRSEKLSPEDQQKIVAIIGELKLLGSGLDNTIEESKQKFTQAQQELRDSIRQLIILTLLSLVVCVIVICATLFALFRFQIAPLLNTTTSSLETFAGAMERLSASSATIAAYERGNERRFARKQALHR